jgi:hypothetical protein
MSAAPVRHTDLLAEMPETWRCLICHGPQRREDGAPCERCGGWLHWPCYWPAALTDAERAAFDAALVADADVERVYVEVETDGQRFGGLVIDGESAVDDYLNRQIILCPGCRS